MAVVVVFSYITNKMRKKQNLKKISTLQLEMVDIVRDLDKYVSLNYYFIIYVMILVDKTPQSNFGL